MRTIDKSKEYVYQFDSDINSKLIVVYDFEHESTDALCIEDYYIDIKDIVVPVTRMSVMSLLRGSTLEQIEERLMDIELDDAIQTAALSLWYCHQRRNSRYD